MVPLSRLATRTGVVRNGDTVRTLRPKTAGAKANGDRIPRAPRVP